MESKYTLSLTDEQKGYMTKNIEKANQIYSERANNSKPAKENHECPYIDAYVRNL